MSDKLDYALITGASGGIGEQIAHEFAKDSISLILVARNKEQLERVKAEIIAKYDVEVLVYSADLSKTDQVHGLHQWTVKEGLTVRYLVNNAGFGDRAPTIAADTDRLEGMVRLNIEALVVLSRLFGADMAASKGGNIVNIASVAGFFPGPGMAVYFATKAFVLSFSQALHAELEASGVLVTTVCPGATRSGFAQAAHAEGNSIFSGKLPSAQEVGIFAYQAMKTGKYMAVWSWKNQILTHVIGLLPRKLVVNAVRRIRL